MNVRTDEFFKTVKELMFIAETVAHLRGLEREILPTVEKMEIMMDAIDNEGYVLFQP